MTGSNSYRIRQGESLSAIARRNKTSVDALARANNIRDPDRIVAGKTLVVPGGRDGFEANGPRPMPRPANRPTGESQARDRFEAGAAQGAAPSGVAGASGTRNGYRNVDLTAFRQGGSNSESAVIVGTSEGNRTPKGGFTASYGGHTDPGNAKHNRGSFSYQGRGATSPSKADEIWNRELGRVTPQYQRAAGRAGLDPNNALLASTFYDLHTQSPRAAQNFLNRELPRLAQDPRGVTPEALVDARVNAYRDNRGRISASGFNHDANRLRADQARREQALVRALDARGYRDGGAVANAPIPQPRPERLQAGAGTTELPSQVPIPRPRPENLKAAPASAESATPTDLNDSAEIAPAADRPAVQTTTPWVSQYDASKVERAGDKACFRAAVVMAAGAGATVTGPDRRIQVATGDDPNGGVTVDAAAARRGRAYIDGQLDAGKPVVVGVDHRSGRNSDNVDSITDHFVVITGRGTDEQGRTYYTFNDPATRHQPRGADSNPNNRFYVDAETGNLYRPGPTDGNVVTRHFEVSMVRPNA